MGDWKSNFERRDFHKALEKAELRRIRFHDLRHTFASRLLQNGESVVYVKDQLRHHSIKVTVDVYGHLVPGANKAAVDRLDEQARALEAAVGQGDAGAVQAAGEPIERNPTQPPRNQGSPEKQRGATDRSVTPRQELVELRRIELACVPQLAQKTKFFFCHLLVVGAGNDTAALLYREAHDLAERRGMRPVAAHCYLGLGQLHARRADRDHAVAHLTTATTMYRDMAMDLDDPDGLRAVVRGQEGTAPRRGAARGVTRPPGEIILGRRPYSLGRRRGACGHRDRQCHGDGLGCGRPASGA